MSKILTEEELQAEIKRLKEKQQALVKSQNDAIRKELDHQKILLGVAVSENAILVKELQALQQHQTPKERPSGNRAYLKHITNMVKFYNERNQKLREDIARIKNNG